MKGLLETSEPNGISAYGTWCWWSLWSSFSHFKFCGSCNYVNSRTWGNLTKKRFCYLNCQACWKTLFQGVEVFCYSCHRYLRRFYFFDTLLPWDKSSVGCHPISKIKQMTQVLNKTPFAITIWPVIYGTMSHVNWMLISCTKVFKINLVWLWI